MSDYDRALRLCDSIDEWGGYSSDIVFDLAELIFGNRDAFYGGEQIIDDKEFLESIALGLLRYDAYGTLAHSNLRRVIERLKKVATDE